MRTPKAILKAKEYKPTDEDSKKNDLTLTFFDFRFQNRADRTKN